MIKVLSLLALSLALVACSSEPEGPKPPPPVYSVIQYRGDGQVLNSWSASIYWGADGCIAFRKLGDDQNIYAACGAVYAEPEEKPATTASAPYQVVQYLDDGAVRATFDATHWFISDGVVVFTVPGDDTQRLITGNVVAKPRLQ